MPQILEMCLGYHVELILEAHVFRIGALMVTVVIVLRIVARHCHGHDIPLDATLRCL